MAALKYFLNRQLQDKLNGNFEQVFAENLEMS